MNSWSIRRKRIILLIVLVFLVILVGVPIYFVFNKTPICTDNKMNGDESGIDCGGSCERFCTRDALPLIMRTDPRILTVATSTYEIVTVVENPNLYGEVREALYSIKLYSSSSTAPIKVIEGKTYIPKNSTFALFEGPFVMENVVPTKAIFEWKGESLVWQRNEKLLPNLRIQDMIFTGEDSDPRLDAFVVNESLEDQNSIEVVVLVYDRRGNIFASSKTWIDTIAKGESVPIVFTWPTPLQSEVISVDILPRILPDRTYLR